MKLVLPGRTNSKVSYFVIDENSDSYASDTSKQYNPPVGDDTVFAIFFNNGLYAVNPDTGAAPEKLTLYRHTAGENADSKIAVINLGEAKTPTYIFDYGACNKVKYGYVIYPENDSKVYSGIAGYCPSDGGEFIEGISSYEQLMTATWDESYQAYMLDKIFFFDLNNKRSPYNNNAVVQKNQTFGRYFNIQHGATNVLSGQVSSMLGYYDCATGSIVTSFEMRDAIRWLTTDDTTKFFKNAAGYFLPVDITSAITFQPEIGDRMSSVQFEWTECKIPHPATLIGVTRE